VAKVLSHLDDIDFDISIPKPMYWVMLTNTWLVSLPQVR
jgi:hypothetical protein